MALDWIVGWWSGTTSSAGLGQSVYLTLVTLSELEDKGDSLRVERVVGQYYIENADDVVGTLLHTRLTVRPSHPVNGPYISSIADPDGAEERFMWHKVHNLPPRGSTSGTNMDGAYTHPEWSHIDVKVNRSLNENEELLFVIEPALQFHDANALDIYKYAAWLRVLVSS